MNDGMVFKYYRYTPSGNIETASWHEIDVSEVPPGAYKYPDFACVRLYVGNPDGEMPPEDKLPSLLGFDTLWIPFANLPPK